MADFSEHRGELMAHVNVKQLDGQNKDCTRRFSFIDMAVEMSSDLEAIIDQLMSKVSALGMSKAKEETVTQHMKMLRKEQTIFLRNQFLFNAIRECSAADDTRKSFLDKVGNFIALEEMPSYIPCSTTADCGMPVIVKLKNEFVLTPEEANELRYIVSLRVVRNFAQIKCVMYDSGPQSTSWFPLTEGEEMLILTKNLLGESINTYNSVALSYLNDIQVMHHICEQSHVSATCIVDWFEKRCSLLQLKARILHSKISLAFYSEEPHQVEAMQLLSAILMEKINDLKVELKKLQSTVTQYNMLRGTEYDTVLQEYINTARKLKEQMWTLDKMRKH